MATVTGLTAARMQEIIDATVVSAHITGDDLILVLHDATEVNAGDVRGPIGPQGPAGDVGDIKTSIRSSIPGYLILNGQAIAGANVSYADLWAVAPPAWKFGTTLTLPDMTNRITEGGGTVGAVTGSNTSVITGANLPPHAHAGPAHTHTIDHDHPQVASSDRSAAHVHSIAHDHPNFVTALGGGHDHQSKFVAHQAGTGAGRFLALDQGEAGFSFIGSTTFPGGGNHQHNVDVPFFSGNSGGENVGHYHNVDIPNYIGSSGAATAANTGNGPGTSTPVNVEQAALRVNYFIRY